MILRVRTLRYNTGFVVENQNTSARTYSTGLIVENTNTGARTYKMKRIEASRRRRAEPMRGGGWWDEPRLENWPF